MNRILMVGKRFGNLYIKSELPIRKHKKIVFNCVCDCGNEREIVGANILNGDTKSCGCLKMIGISTHKKSKTNEYRCWADMIQRCTNPKSTNFKYYGAIGINVCDRWLNSFENFLEDMGIKPTKKHSIDRIISSGNYEPENCRWATRKIQNENKKSNRNITFDGKTMILKYWAILLNVKYQTLWDYLKRHSFEDAYKHYLGNVN